MSEFATMSFLPEDDEEYLRGKGLPFEEKAETLPDKAVRKGVEFANFEFEGNLYELRDGQLMKATRCRLLILIPTGYATTKLDSFYTKPRLLRPDRNTPDRAAGESELFSEKNWQFWSRHLADGEWRPGIDGLETFLQYVRAELRRA